MPAASACYECARTSRGYQLLNIRYSCPLLRRQDILAGKVPTPFWDQARVTADNPVERLPSYDNKRIFLVCGLDEDVNETPVRNGQREFRGLLTSRGTPHEWHELPGAHFVRREMLQADIDGVIGRLKKA